MPIKGLSEKRRLPRLGKIHLGTRHPQKGYPIKTDYFVCPPEVLKVFGEKLKELRILIPVEDEEKWASQYYRCYSKTRGLICKGDGETALRMIDTQTGAMADRDSKKVEMKEMSCQGRDCTDYKTKCKEVMNLQFLLPEVPGLGIWQIDTSSINSIKNINSACELIKGMFGRIAMVPLLLTLEPTEVNNPEDGKRQTVYCLNLRTNATLVQLAGAAKKQVELLGMPVPDDERPEFAPEFEPDEVELPPDNRTAQEQIDDLWRTEKPTPKPVPAVSPTTSVENKPPATPQPQNPTGKDDKPGILSKDELKTQLAKAKWSQPEALKWLKSQGVTDATGTLSEILSRCSPDIQGKFETEIKTRASMA